MAQVHVIQYNLTSGTRAPVGEVFGSVAKAKAYLKALSSYYTGKMVKGGKCFDVYDDGQWTGDVSIVSREVK